MVCPGGALESAGFRRPSRGAHLCAFVFRWLRFGQLPERVLPDDRVELVETESRQVVSVVHVGATGAWYVNS